jgi:hypothetical protein
MQCKSFVDFGLFDGWYFSQFNFPIKTYEEQNEEHISHAFKFVQSLC